METDEEREIDHLAARVDHYLACHPEACDTIDGILTWWVERSVYLEKREMLDKALSLLVEKGFVGINYLPDGRRIYSRKAPQGEIGSAQRR